MKKILRFLTWRSLGILRYNSIWQNSSALLGLLIIQQNYQMEVLAQAGLFFLFSTCMTGYGYLVNDFGDRDLDRQQGKSNVFARSSPPQAALVIFTALAAGAVCAFPFWSRPGFLGLWLAWLGLATFYSLPPLRLKERGAIGLAATIAAQQTLPTALLLAAFDSQLRWTWLFVLLFSTARGVSSDTGNQLHDYENDRRTATPTWAVRVGLERNRQVYAAALELERLGLGLLVGFLAAGLPPIEFPGSRLALPLILPLGLVYLVLLGIAAGRSLAALRDGRLFQADP